MRKALLGLNVVLIAALLGLGWAAWRQRGEAALWQEREATAARRVAELKARRKAVPRAAAATRGANLGATANFPSGTESAASSTGVSESKPSLEKSPAEAQAGRLDRERDAWQERMNALHNGEKGLEEMHLAPEVVARAKELLLQEWDVSKIRRAQRSPEEIRADFERFSRERDEKFIALLGAGPYAEFQSYNHEEHYDWTIGTDMWDGGAPMSPDQLHALCRAVVDTKYEDRRPMAIVAPSQAPDPVTGLSAQDEALLTRSTAFLTPEQQRILRQSLMDENRYNAAMRSFDERQRALWNQAKG